MEEKTQKVGNSGGVILLKYNTGGFTLIELLVVISIISLLASVIITSVAEAREDARNAYTIQTIYMA